MAGLSAKTSLRAQKKTGPRGPVFFYLVEVRRIELLSENLSAQVSPGAVRRLRFPRLTRTNALQVR